MMSFISEEKAANDEAFELLQNGNTVQDAIYYLMTYSKEIFNSYKDAEEIVLEAKENLESYKYEAKMCEGLLSILDKFKNGLIDIDVTHHHIEGFIEGACYSHPKMKQIMVKHQMLAKRIFVEMIPQVHDQLNFTRWMNYYEEELEFYKNSAEIFTEHLAKNDISVPSPIGYPEDYIKYLRKIVGVQLYQKQLVEFKYALAVADCTEKEFMKYIDHSTFSLRDFIHLNYPRKGFKKALRQYLQSIPRTKATLEELQEMAKEKQGERMLISILGQNYEETWLTKN
jgi:hypothetical protein